MIRTIFILSLIINSAVFSEVKFQPKDINVTNENIMKHFKSSDIPVTFTTPEMIEKAKKRVFARKEPWFTAYKNIKDFADSGLNSEIVPYTDSDMNHGKPDNMHDTAVKDFCIARNCALIWHIQGDTKYLNRAKKILLEWARAKPEPMVHIKTRYDYPNYWADAGLLVSAPTVFYCHAYSLVYDQFSKAERAEIELWLRKLVSMIKIWHLAWTANNYYNYQLYNNHLSWHNAAIGYTGFVLKDPELVRFAIDHPENPRDLKEMIAGAILIPGDNKKDAFETVFPGEIYDRYRTSQGKGLDYAMYHMLAIVYLAEAAYNNSINMYCYTAPGGENIFLPYSFYSHFIAKEDSTLKHGFYTGDRVPVHYATVYDLINKRYPGHDEIVEVLKTHGRHKEPARGQHAGTIALTHAIPIDSDSFERKD